MSAYYNEIEPFAAQWLANLIQAGHIAPGEVDTRSIVDVQPEDLRGFTQCHFFAGIAGWSHALRLAGWEDTRPVWTGSCPCQPFSAAGQQRGSEDERHLWPAWFRLIRECRPRVVVGEQVAGAAGYAWWDHVAADLEGEGYAAAAADIGAHSVGSPHIRQRLYWVAHDDEGRRPLVSATRLHDHREPGHDAARRGPVGGIDNPWANLKWLSCTDGKSRPTQPGLCPLADGIPGRLGRLRAIGNAIVPQCGAAFVRAVMECLP